jgi:hypothetical protein
MRIHQRIKQVYPLISFQCGPQANILQKNYYTKKYRRYIPTHEIVYFSQIYAVIIPENKTVGLILQLFPPRSSGECRIINWLIQFFYKYVPMFMSFVNLRK